MTRTQLLFLTVSFATLTVGAAVTKSPSQASIQTPAGALRRTSPARNTVHVQPLATSGRLPDLPHHGANPPVVGGPASPSTRSTAEINGTRMKGRLQRD